MATDQSIRSDVSWEYAFRTQPDSYDDDDVGSVDITWESSNNKYAVRINTPYGIIPVWLELAIKPLQEAIRDGQYTFNMAQVHMHIQEHIINVEPWMRIGWNIDKLNDVPAHSGYMWIETKQLHWFLRQLMSYITD